jgi:hypothetical protein
MNRAKPIVTYLPRLRLRPEIDHCPHCPTALAYSHPVWAKPIYGLNEANFVTNLGFRCPNPVCSYPRTVYRSAQAEALSLKGSTYGLDMIVRIGHLWLHEHRNRSEIHAQLRNRVPISERHVQNLFESYLALLRCAQARNLARLPALAQTQGGLVLSLDGLRPENGNESLYVLREVLSGSVIVAECVQEADHKTLATLLKPVADLQLPILGVISDIQESIRLAVAEVFPGVPHAFCHFHVLREAAKPIFEADRHMKKKIKIKVRGLRSVERSVEQELAAQPTAQVAAPVSRPEPHPDPEQPPVQEEVSSQASMSSRDAALVVRDVAWAMRQTLLEGGQTPFQLGGLQVYEDLDTLGQTVEYCLAKKGMCIWHAC